MPGSLYRDLVDILERAGCDFHRQGRGSHEIWRSPVTGGYFSIPSNISSRRLANQILKEGRIAASLLAVGHQRCHIEIMPARKPPRLDEKPQRERFIETAREIGASEDAEEFERVFRTIVHPSTPLWPIILPDNASSSKSAKAPVSKK